MIKVGDRVTWDSEAHTHTKYLSERGAKNSGKIYGILPLGFRHVDELVDECPDNKAIIIWVNVDNSTAKIGLCPNYPDLCFPDSEADEGFIDSVADLVMDLMG